MKYKGFTLIELLVAVSLIAMLLGITMPALLLAKETAKKVICSSNLHTIGVALFTYEQEHAYRLPPQYDRWGPVSQTYDNQHMEPWASYVAYHKDQTVPAGDLQPLQLAYLWHRRSIEDPAVFYCISQGPKGEHLPYTYDYYTLDGKYQWGTYLPTKSNGSPDDKIRISYHYWLHGRSSLGDLANRPIVFDNIQHWNSVAHTQNGQPYGINALYGDGHVSFSNDDALFEVELWNGGSNAGPWDGPGNDIILFEKIVARLRP